MSRPTRFAELTLVALKKNALRWRKLPIAVRTGLVTSVARVRGIREDIERNALTGPMPPVRIVDIAWATERGCAHGRTVPVLRWGDGWLLGAELAAPTALYADDTVLRGVLLHEFAHC